MRTYLIRRALTFIPSMLVVYTLVFSLIHATPGNPWETDRGAGISEATAQRVDEEVRELVMRGYETARQIISKHRAAVRAMAEQLLVVESLDADGIRAVMASAAA